MVDCFSIASGRIVTPGIALSLSISSCRAAEAAKAGVRFNWLKEMGTPPSVHTRMGMQGSEPTVNSAAMHP